MELKVKDGEDFEEKINARIRRFRSLLAWMGETLECIEDGAMEMSEKAEALIKVREKLRKWLNFNRLPVSGKRGWKTTKSSL